MPTVYNQVIINAPVEKVFRYVSQPSNLMQVWPSLIEITHQQLLPNGGYSYRWKYKMSGIRLTGIGECIDLVPNLLLISKNTGAINSTVGFKFQTAGIHTRVSLNFDYQMHLGILGKLPEKTILRMNEKEAGLILDNLRIIFEEN